MTNNKIIKKIIKEEVEKNNTKNFIKKIIKEEIEKNKLLIKESKVKHTLLHLLALATQTADTVSRISDFENIKPPTNQSYILPTNSLLSRRPDDDGPQNFNIDLTKNKQTSSRTLGINLRKAPNTRNHKISTPTTSLDFEIKTDLSTKPFNSLLQDLQINQNDQNSIKILNQLKIDDPILMLTLASRINVPILTRDEKINPKFINLFKQKLENI